MKIGIKIKRLRQEQGMTQKSLADSLYVTAQAVSRWENDEVEPSLETLSKLAQILKCQVQEFFTEETAVETPQLVDIEGETPQLDPEGATIVAASIANGLKNANTKNETTETLVSEKPNGQVIAICEITNNPIYEGQEIHKITVDKKVIIASTEGRDIHNRQQTIKQEHINQQKEAFAKVEKDGQQKRARFWRIFSYIASAISLIVTVVIIIAVPEVWLTTTVIGVGFTFFIATVLLRNNFIFEMWTDIILFVGVKTPGVIFSLDFDGLVFLVAVKIIFFILNILLAIAGFIFATLLAMALSIFVYPFALYLSYKRPERLE